MMRRLQSTLKCSCTHVNRSIVNAASSSFKNEQPFNFYICSLCNQKLFRDALHAFDVFRKKADCVIDPGTYIHLIYACSSLRSVEYGRKIHNHLLRSNLLPYMILENHLINMYGKCGLTGDAKEVFDSMWERNVVSWNAMIAGYSQHGQDIEAIESYIEMQRSGFMPNHFTFGGVIKACSSLAEAGLGEQLHAKVVKSEFGSHLIAQNALIAMYNKFGRINEAWDVFSSIKIKDLISWSSIIAGLSKLGYEIEALSCFKEMLSLGTYHPNEFIFGSVFRACGSLGRPEYGRQIHGVSVKYGFETNAFAGCSLTDMYARCGFLYSAKTSFKLIKHPDIVSWNAVLAAFAYGGDANGAMLFFSQTRHSGSAPNDITVRSLLCGFADPSTLSQGKQVHCYIIKTGLVLDLPVCNTLLSMYANCSEHMDACKMFNDIRGSDADLVSWTAIITMFMHKHWAAEVFSLFRTMLLLHGRPDGVILANVLGACGKFATLEMGDQVNCCAVKYGLDSGIVVMNGLIDMYVKCGSLERAGKVFDCMPNPNVVSWSSLIVGYAQFGLGQEALNLFSQMKKQGIKPNQVTFLGVLIACSHVGMVNEGIHLLKSMEHEHGVIPTREHISCVVDLLARAGRIHDAEAVIDQLGFKPDVVIWKIVLAACKNCGNVEVGRRVAEKILRVDSSNSAAHVLLCNIHASAGNWKDVACLRASMREKGIKKLRGQSWIKVKDQIHIFTAKDGLHQEKDKIFLTLEELLLQISEVGDDPSFE
ncbi:pentatricopeptide repeat-containing protein, mitochondrial [Salvia divinorum]|uniref:Pentatricopeptide repeat-containing protein, mitochondrial n=1 Tax=Salvia divinorum TaxID=28513 RepID=A0ABD1FSI6_SALDI